MDQRGAVDAHPRLPRRTINSLPCLASAAKQHARRQRGAHRSAPPTASAVDSARGRLRPHGCGGILRAFALCELPSLTSFESSAYYRTWPPLLLRAVARCTQLTSLGFAASHLTLDGDRLLAPLEASRSLTSLIHLRIEWCDFDEDCVDDFFCVISRMSSLRELVLAFCGDMDLVLRQIPLSPLPASFETLCIQPYLYETPDPLMVAGLLTALPQLRVALGLSRRSRVEASRRWCTLHAGSATRSMRHRSWTSFVRREGIGSNGRCRCRGACGCRSIVAGRSVHPLLSFEARPYQSAARNSMRAAIIRLFGLLAHVESDVHAPSLAESFLADLHAALRRLRFGCVAKEPRRRACISIRARFVSVHRSTPLSPHASAGPL